jgi:hypothetical protein
MVNLHILYNPAESLHVLPFFYEAIFYLLTSKIPIFQRTVFCDLQTSVCLNLHVWLFSSRLPAHGPLLQLS